MNKKIKQVGAGILALSLIAGNMPMYASAATSAKSSETKASSLIETLKQKYGVEENDQEYREGEAVVMYYGTTSTKSAANNEKIFGNDITVEEVWNFSGTESSVSSKSTVKNKSLLVSKVSSKKYSTEELVKRLSAQQNVEYAEPNYIYKATGTTNTADYADYQWSLNNTGQNGGTAGDDINVESAWKTATGTDKVIAIIDTGLDYTHEDLKDNVWVNEYTSVLKGSHGYDFANNDDDPMDDNGHGSHCAGIIAGSGNGISGVNQTAKIMSLKFLDESGYGDLSGAVAAYDYISRAIDLGVDVVAINNSWGGGESGILESLVNIVGAKGAITVAAAGNDAMDGDVNSIEPWYFDSDYIIKVAASNEDDEIANFSNYGKETVDLAAPGADILSSVCYDCYNPSLHIGDENYSELLRTFETEDETSDIQFGDMPQGSTMEVTLGEGFGAADTNSLQINLNATESDYVYTAYIPITLPESATEYYMSAVVKASALSSMYGYGMAFVGINRISNIEDINNSYEFDALSYTDAEYGRNYWDKLTIDTELNKADSDTPYAICIAFIADEAGEYSIQIDDIGISKQNMETDEFGKYDFYNGTSMAAPCVTGAVALLSELNENLSTEDLRDAVANCVRTTEDGKAMTKSGGVLDLSVNNNQLPYIKNIESEEGNIVITGNFFGSEKGTVTLNDSEASIVSWSNKKIVVAAEGYDNKYVGFSVKTATGNEAQDYLYLSKNDTEITQLPQEELVSPAVVGTDGNNIYALEEGGIFYKYEEQVEDWIQLNPLSVMVVDPTCIVDDETAFTFSDELVYVNNRFYTIATSDKGYYKAQALVYYDFDQECWVKAASLPEGYDSVELSTLTAYKNKLYLIGGYDVEKETALTSVYSLDVTDEDAVMQKEAAEIPARFGAKAVVVGDKLVLTLGGDGTVDENVFDSEYVAVPNNVVFDGTSWTEVANSSITPDENNILTLDSGNVVPYYTAQTGLYEGGIIYTDLYTKDLGNVFTYDLQNNSYKALPCSLYDLTKDSNKVFGVSVGDEFIFVASTTSTEYEEDFWGDIEIITNSSSALYSFPVKNGFYQVTSDDNILGAGNHYPGSKVTIIPALSAMQYLKSFTVNGEEVEDDTYVIDAIDQDYEVEVTSGYYIAEISFPKSEYDTVVGQELELKPVIEPEEAESTSLIWMVDNEDYATIDEDGVLTPLKAGEGKTVTVTVMSSDEFGTMASVKVNIKVNNVTATKISLNKKAVTVNKGDSYQLTATLQPSNVSSKNLIWESSKSSVAMISSTGEIIALKAGKTTITARTTDGSNLSATCEVEVVIPVTKVTLNKTSATVKVGQSVTLKATAEPTNTTYKTVTWKTSDSKVATVSNGKVTAKGIGTATITATVGGKKATCKVVVTPNDVKNVKAKQTTKSITLSWSKVSGASGYTVYRYDSASKKDVVVSQVKKGSTTSVTINKLTAGTEYTYKVAAYKTVNKQNIYGSKATIKTATKPNAAKIKSVSSKKSGQAAISFSKVSGATGYEVVMSTSKSKGFKKIVNVTGKTSYTKTGLTKGKTYYFKVRAYKTVDGKKVYGNYSAVKSVKVK